MLATAFVMFNTLPQGVTESVFEEVMNKKSKIKQSLDSIVACYDYLVNGDSGSGHTALVQAQRIFKMEPYGITPKNNEECLCLDENEVFTRRSVDEESWCYQLVNNSAPGKLLCKLTQDDMRKRIVTVKYMSFWDDAKKKAKTDKAEDGENNST